MQLDTPNLDEELNRVAETIFNIHEEKEMK